MFLRKLKVENFRCFKELEIDFEAEDQKANRKHTIILGQNGTGKSNLLKAIALVTAGSNALGEILGDPESWIKNGKKSCSISAEITTADNESRELKLEIYRGDYLGDVITNNRESLSLIDRAIDHTDRNYFVMALGASRRLAGRKRSNSSENFFETTRANNIATLINRDTSLNSLENWAINLDYKKDKKGLEIVKRSLKSFLPGVTFQEINKDTRQLIFKTPDGLVTLDLLSDGYQNMAAWLGDLLYRVTTNFQDRKDPMKARGLILIDEIDLHLHPLWQHSLLDFFETKLPNFQIVATTHSPMTAQQAGAGELYSLVRERSDIKLTPFNGSPSNILVSQLLMSPVFGLESDESFSTQKLKRRYEELSGKKSLSEPEKLELDDLSQKIQGQKAHRSNSLLREEDRELLNELRNTLAKKK